MIRKRFLVLLLVGWTNAFSVPNDVVHRTRQQQQGFCLRSVASVGLQEAAAEQDADEEYDRVLFTTAAVPPLLAFLFWGEVAHTVSYLFDVLGFNGSNVDGNAFANNLLRPTINGVVVPSAGIGTGTLFATTVNVLWNRQLTLRTSINTEVCELRHLRRALLGCFGTAQHANRRKTALRLLLSYTRTVISETQSDCIQQLQDMELNQGISKNELDGTW